MPLQTTRNECPACGARRGFAEDDSGSGHCFSCGHHPSGGASHTPDHANDFMSTASSTLIPGVEIRPIGNRNLDRKICQKYNYGFGQWKGREVQVASWENDAGTVVAQKLRFVDDEGRKSFVTLGDSSKIGLWGKTRVRPDGRMVIITEGELDALSVAQVFGGKYPVVSLPHGAGTARKHLKRELRWLQNFEEVVLCFDEDEAGRKAVEDVKDLFEPGTLRITRLPMKDASDMLKARRGDDLYRAIWDSQRYTPTSLLSGEDLLTRATERYVTEIGPYPWEELNAKTGGIRGRELIMLTAGSGVGKSTFCSEISAHCLSLGESVALIALEADPYRSTRGVYTVHANKPLTTEHGPETKPLVEAAHKEWGDRLFVFDGFGSSNFEEICGIIRYAAKGLGVRCVVLDHVSIIVSSLDTDDERRAIDEMMTKLRKLVEETGIALFLVSHLKRPQGKGHEDGGQVSLSQLRGSASLAQLSDLVIGIERDQQSEDEAARNISTLRCLKNRYSGKTGPAGKLKYVEETGRMIPCTDFDGGDFS